MRTQVITCQLTTPIDKIAKTLIQHRIHRIIVVDSDRPVGIITSLDLVRLLVGA
jgi:CBS domain-containing protein